MTGSSLPLPAALLVALAAASPAGAQADAGGSIPDTLPPADTTGAASDTAAADTLSVPRALLFPEAVQPGEGFTVADEWAWSREEILDSSAFTLLDFLRDEAPGLLPLRTGYFAGPHHLMDGALGPGSVRVYVDGRELPGLTAGQPDLAEVSLSRIDRLRIVRRPGRTEVRVRTLRHEGGEAYSRVGAGTGDPAADALQGVFVNGFGRHATVGGGVDYLNAAAGATPASRLDAWARLAWVPLQDAGVELLWRNEGLDRTLQERRSEFDRGELYLHGRGRVGDAVGLDVWAGRTTREPARGGGRRFEVEEMVGRLAVSGGSGYLVGRAALRDARTYPGLEARATAGLSVGAGLTLEAAGEFVSWDDFETSRLSAGLAFRPELGLGLEPWVRAEASRGSRGTAGPLLGRARKFSLDGLALAGGMRLGPYRISERVTLHDVGRQLSFGVEVDSALRAGPSARVTGFETRGSGPILPVDPLAERFRMRGWWRWHTTSAGRALRYLPANLGHGEFYFRDRFFEENLEVRLSLRITYRSAMLTARPDTRAPEAIPAEFRVNSGVVLEVDDRFHLWWRRENLTRQLFETDFAGLRFPRVRNLFGVKWEFVN